MTKLADVLQVKECADFSGDGTLLSGLVRWGPGQAKEAFGMASLAMAYPILPGRTDDWRRLMAEVNGPRRAEYDAGKQHGGGRSAVFLKQTPQGDLVLVTMDGADPYRAVQQMWTGNDPF